MKVYLTYENKTQSIAQVLISAWEKKIYLLKKWFPKSSDVDKTQSQRKTVSSLDLAITKHDMDDLLVRKLVFLILDATFCVLFYFILFY